jgi:hypothetical protein
MQAKIFPSWMWRVMFAVAVAGFLVAGATGSDAKARAQPQDRWTTYTNTRFGYRFYYPSALFQAGQLPEDGGGQTFTSTDGRAKIVVYATHNTEKFSPAQYRKIILKDFGGYDRMDYSPSGQSWFVLSGFRGENIYYQKVMFSCGNRVINAISITFPTAEKPRYEELIEIIEDNFKPGRGADTPQGC